jgi:hypothetical protein
MNENLDSEKKNLETSARNWDIDCSGYNIQDYYSYDYASFDYTIYPDWSSASVQSNMLINDSKSADFRESLDQLFEGLPGGNNDWISTDEVDAWMAIGPDCIADMETGTGIREGIHHRGGVDWNDFEFVEEGIALNEADMIPNSHPESRQCQNFAASSNCVEIPVTATNDLQSQLFVENGETNNMRFNQLLNQGSQNFTIAMNLTNITSAEFSFNLPPVQDLRISDYSLLNDGLEDSSFSLDDNYLSDGSLIITFQSSYSSSDWPIVKNIFIDLTTVPDPTPDIPQWTVNAPDDGTLIPLGVVDYAGISSWYSGDDGAFFKCDFEESGWSSSVNLLGLQVDSPNGSVSSNAECRIENSYDDSNQETRNYTFGIPFTLSSDIIDVRDYIELLILPTGFVNEFDIVANALQIPFFHWDNNAIDASNSDSFDTDIGNLILQTTSLSPGPVWIEFTVTSDNMLEFQSTIGPVWIKYSLPPQVSITNNLAGENVTWSSSKDELTIRGQVSDPDGESITLSLDFCGAQYQNFEVAGSNWEIRFPVESCFQNGISHYLVNITATDASLNLSSIILDVTPDSDGDGFNNHYDVFPTDPNEWYDSDNDAVGDNSDAFPNDSNETHDDDLDGVGNNSDAFPNDSTETKDSDNDGVGDNSDAFPFDSNETHDDDLDGVGNNSDAFPNDSTETKDSDNDGFGDNSDDCRTISGNSTLDVVGCLDNDGDGWSNSIDAFINNSEEWNDTDGDGVGDIKDAFPSDDSETKDSDGDGVGDNEQLESEQRTRTITTISIIALLIIGGSLVGVFYFKKKNIPLDEHEKESPKMPESEQIEISGEQNIETISQQAAVNPVESQWTDERGYTWRKMSDGSTHWWDGTHWNPYEK